MPESAWKSLVFTSNDVVCLKSILDSFKSDAESWHEWFKSPSPELIRLPCEENQTRTMPNDDGDASLSSNQADADAVSNQNGPSLAYTESTSSEPHEDVKKLLTIKCLRPDRFHDAIKVMHSSDMGDLQQQDTYSFEELFLGNAAPKIILLPSSTSANESMPSNRHSIVAKLLGNKAQVCFLDISFNNSLLPVMFLLYFS